MSPVQVTRMLAIRMRPSRFQQPRKPAGRRLLPVKQAFPSATSRPSAPSNSMDLPSQSLLEKQRTYWEQCDPTVHGMLGGFEAVHPVDVEASKAFIAELLPLALRHRALDCGAGIGRVSLDVLVPSGFSKVDLMDISPSFLQTARSKLPADKLGHLYTSGLAEFDFSVGQEPWSMIWVQWCAIYLKDDAFVSFFRRAAQHVSKEGFVVLKENILRKDVPPVPDESDASVTRSDQHLKRLWKLAGLQVVAQLDQPHWPTSLFPVRMYALQAVSANK